MKFVIDMNLSPRLQAVLDENGYEAIHWSQVGDARATDSEIMRWAVENDCVVLTHDLDFGAMLAATQATAPSVVQVRTQFVQPDVFGCLLVELISRHKADLDTGALLVLDVPRDRVRLLPLKR